LVRVVGQRLTNIHKVISIGQEWLLGRMERVAAGGPPWGILPCLHRWTPRMTLARADAPAAAAQGEDCARSTRCSHGHTQLHRIHDFYI
jgi:hypothetical protein